MAVIINFQCKKCRKVFDCDVGLVDVDEKTFRPLFGKKIVCPGCGERSLEDVFLTELGQSQLTTATLDFDDDELDFDDVDEEDDIITVTSPGGTSRWRLEACAGGEK
jgi:hypothetical protein